MHSYPIEIKISKVKLLFYSALSLIFIFIGLWLFNATNIEPRYHPTFLKIVGLTCVALFGFGFLYFIKKMFDSKVGLSIDKNGIYDNSSPYSVGLIKWKDIRNISTLKVKRMQFLLIEITNPELYIQNAKNGFTARLLKLNYKFCGSPICIQANSLKIKFRDLEDLIMLEYKKNSIV